MTLISELPRGLKELAEIRRSEQGGTKDKLHLAFKWRDSTEGYDFWNCINDYNFSVFYNCKVSKVVKKAFPEFVKYDKANEVYKLHRMDGELYAYYLDDKRRWGIWAKCKNGKLICTSGIPGYNVLTPATINEFTIYNSNP